VRSHPTSDPIMLRTHPLPQVVLTLITNFIVAAGLSNARR